MRKFTVTPTRLAVLFACSFAFACQEPGGQIGDATPVPLPANWPVHAPEDSPLLPVAEDDPCYEAVAVSIAGIEERYAQGKWLDAVFRPPLEIKGKAVRELFPDHRFFVLVWDEKRKPLPPGTPRPSGLAVALHSSIAVDKKGTATNLGRGSGFGDFLAETGVKISNVDDARLVWNAFCEIARQERKGKIEKVSDHVWRLGLTPRIPEDESSGKRYLEVHLKADFSVRSARMQSE
jgi:hypothetical protein